MCFVCSISQKCLYCNHFSTQMVFNSFLAKISPNDPNGVYKLSAYCALIGSVGMVVAPFLRELINTLVVKQSSKCGSDALTDLNHTCIGEFFVYQSSHIGWYEFSHLIIMLFGIITCIPFYAMEDLFSAHDGSKVMRSLLLIGTVLEIMNSAFSVGLRVSSGIMGGIIFRRKGDIYPQVSMLFANSILSSSFTWLTFFRDLILGLGVYMACVYDKELDVIGGNWRMLGYVTAVAGAVTCLLELLKLWNFNFFDNKSDITYFVFLLCYAIWLFLFGLHCRSLVSPDEEKGMLADDASSGADVSDDDMDAAPVRQSTVQEEQSEEEEEATETRHKKRRHHKKAVSSDDDV